MTSIQYITQEVNRQCAVPGTMIIYDKRAFTVTENSNGKLVLSRISERRIICDLLVNIILDKCGKPIIN